MKVYTREATTGSWVTETVASDGISISDRLNERSSATIRILDSTGVKHYQPGYAIRVTTDADDLIFRGFIHEAEERRVGLGGLRAHDLECSDVHYLLDKRVVAAAYEAQTAGAIVAAIITSTLTAEGVTAGNVSDGATVQAISFNYVTAAEAITELAVRSGFWWRVRPNTSADGGLLDFGPPDALMGVTADSTGVTGDASALTADSIESAGFTIDITDDALANSVNVKRQAFAYRNRQWIRGGQDRTSSQVEVHLGTGEARAFALGYPVAEEPVVEVDRGAGYVTETAGAAGIETTRKWFYAVGNPTIRQNSDETVLSTTDKVRITYYGLFDVIARVDDTPAQADLALLEGGSGIVEHVLYDRAVGSSNEAVQLAAQLTGYYADDAVELRALFDGVPYRVGTTVVMTFAEAGIEERSAIVLAVESFTSSGRERSVVTFAFGPLDGSWAQWFAALNRKADRASNTTGRTVETVTTIVDFTKVWTAVETPNIFREARVGTAVVGTATPEFVAGERVRYVEWIRDGVAIGRKARTQTTGTTTLETITVLTNLEAVGSITEVAWYGGDAATETLGSGVEVDKQAYVKTKTDLEQIQLRKTDTKWA